MVGNCVVLAVDLGEGFLCRTAHLELHHIDRIVHEHDDIGLSARHFHLRERAAVEDGKDHVGEHLVVGLVFGDVVQLFLSEEEGHLISNQPDISFVVNQNRNLEAHFSYVEGAEEMETIRSVSPNPTLGIVTVQGTRESEMIHVVDGNGHVVLTKKCEGTETTLDLSFVTEGWYTLLVLSEGKMHVVKLIRASR